MIQAMGPLERSVVVCASPLGHNQRLPLAGHMIRCTTDLQKKIRGNYSGMAALKGSLDAYIGTETEGRGMKG
jgi:hypothetical protein